MESQPSPPVVFVCTPFAPKEVLGGPVAPTLLDNIRFARACALACVQLGEVPVLPHLVYPQILDDRGPDQERGLALGHALLARCDTVVVYTDRGMSTGMQRDVSAAARAGVPVVWRTYAAGPLVELDAMPTHFPPLTRLGATAPGAALVALLRGLDDEGASRAFTNADNVQDFLNWLVTYAERAEPTSIEIRGVTLDAWSQAPLLIER